MKFWLGRTLCWNSFQQSRGESLDSIDRWNWENWHFQHSLNLNYNQIYQIFNISESFQCYRNFCNFFYEVEKFPIPLRMKICTISTDSESTCQLSQLLSIFPNRWTEQRNNAEIIDNRKATRPTFVRQHAFELFGDLHFSWLRLLRLSRDRTMQMTIMTRTTMIEMALATMRMSRSSFIHQGTLPATKMAIFFSSRGIFRAPRACIKVNVGRSSNLMHFCSIILKIGGHCSTIRHVATNKLGRIEWKEQ